MSDSTADSTAIIIIDSTSTDAQNMQATVANSLVGDFAASMGPIASKCDTLAYKTNKIKDQISGMTPTKPSLLDELLANALNAAYQSSAWAMAAGASQGISDVLAKCDYFQDAANRAGKYVNAGKFIGSLMDAAKDKADQAIDAMKAKFGGSGDFPELGIGKALSDIVSTGRTVYDKVEDALGDVADALSPIIEYGKNAVNQVQTELAGAAKELAKLDKLINCLDAIGGSDYASIIDGMTDEMECYYEKLGVFSDPNFANFGEFDVDGYLNTIGVLSPESAKSIKKSLNLYNKSRKNAEGAMAKAADVGIKTPSALNPAAITDTITKKAEYAETASKTSYEVPAIPGKTETKTVTIPTPEPVTAPPISSGDPPIPENKIPYTTLIKETEFTFDEQKTEDNYDKYDPEHAQFNKYISSAYAGITKINIIEPTPLPNIKLTVMLISGKVYAKSKSPFFKEKVWLISGRILVLVALHNIDTHRIVSEYGNAEITGDHWVASEDDPFTDADITDVVIRGIIQATKEVVFTAADVQPTLK